MQRQHGQERKAAQARGTIIVFSRISLTDGVWHQPKKLKSSAQPSPHSTSVQFQVQGAQKKAVRKNKAANTRGGKGDGPVLGGADYVTLMMGGRRKAKEEAVKLPRDSES